MIRKEVCLCVECTVTRYCVSPHVLLVQAYVHKSVLEELKRIIQDSEIMQEDDTLWPPPDRVGRQVIDSPNQFSVVTRLVKTE